MNKIRVYDGEFRRLVVDFEIHEIIEDSLDREKIWQESGESYYHQAIIYSEIIAELDPQDFSTPRKEDEIWRGCSTDFGFKCYLDDGWVFLVDAEESNFYKEE